MRRSQFLHSLATVAVFLIVACAPQSVPRSSEGGATQAAPQRVLVGIARAETPSLSGKPLTQFTGSFGQERPAFNANLSYTDERGLAYPYLAQTLPELRTNTWQVFPDGRMESTYRLRPNLTWHDGSPLTSDDFLFSLRVYRVPEFGYSSTAPISQMEDVLAPDPLTVVIRWKQIYVDAGKLTTGFPPVPRHLLGAAFESMDPVAFASQPFWTVGTDYNAAGPYRLTRWEPGAFLEGAAFAAHTLGRPKIDRIKIVFIQDPATALANLLAGEAHYVGDFVFTATDGQTMENMWKDNKGGTVLWAATTYRYSAIQMRPEYADPPAILDVRVRRAMAYAMDNDTAVETQHYGKAVRTVTVTHPLVDYYLELAPYITNYPNDPRRAVQLLEEAGQVRGADGFYADRNTGKRLAFDYRTFSGERGESENAVFVDSLRKVGIDARQSPFTPAEARDGMALATFPALSFRGGGNLPISQSIPREANRWIGNNIGGYSNPEYDRLNQSFLGALDRADIVRFTGGMEKIFTEEVPTIAHYFIPGVIAHLNMLQGPSAALVPGGSGGWGKVYAWEWRQDR